MGLVEVALGALNQVTSASAAGGTGQITGAMPSSSGRQGNTRSLSTTVQLHNLVRIRRDNIIEPSRPGIQRVPTLVQILILLIDAVKAAWRMVDGPFQEQRGAARTFDFR